MAPPIGRIDAAGSVGRVAARRIGAAVVGLGYWGPRILRSLSSLPEACVLHLVDHKPEAACRAAETLQPRPQAGDDLEAALDDPEVEAVAIATPPSTHFDLARRALLAGKHVLVEKPMALSVEHCRTLEALAAARGRILMVGHVFLFSEGVRAVKRAIDEGLLGDLLYAHGRRVNLGRIRTDTSALWSLAPHDFSILGHWYGAAPLRVSARGFSYLRPGVEDVVFCTVEYPEGRAAHLHLSWLDARKVRELTLVGTRGMAVLDEVAGTLRLLAFEHQGRDVIVPRAADAGHEDLDARLLAAVELAGEEPLRAELAHFLACVRGEATCLCPGRQGRNVATAILAAEESLRRAGAPVALAELQPASGGDCLGSAVPSSGS